ncbi:hypothetical protein HPP92_005007 [Vanilla planifolia]|uniref:Uncharacterized protein n=1 Tax=Vanilla planifolia TaxID=51239 RepID=A0A835RM56_VANPL|nr:hypothetical protein HPP92_005007 [Vanilla planifolia]
MPQGKNGLEDEYIGKEVSRLPQVAGNKGCDGESEGLIGIMEMLDDTSEFKKIHKAVQVAATKVLSRICAIASGLRPYSLENIVLPDPLQVHDLAFNICRILDEDLCKRDLLISVFDLLVSAAYFQPSILLPILSARVEAGSSVPAGNESKLTESPIVYTSKCVVGSSIDLMLKYVRRSEVLISSDPHLLLSILNFFKALWDGGIQYNDALKMIRKSATFWEQLSAILAGEHIFDDSVKDCGSDDIHCPSYRVKCQGIVLEIIAREIFILEGFSQTEICEKHTSTNSSKGLGKNGLSIKASLYPSMFQQIDIISSWYEGSQFDVLMKSCASIAFDMEIIFNTKSVMSSILEQSLGCFTILSSYSVDIAIVNAFSFVMSPIHAPSLDYSLDQMPKIYLLNLSGGYCMAFCLAYQVLESKSTLSNSVVSDSLIENGSTKNLLPVLTILMRTLGSCLKLLGGLSISPMLQQSSFSFSLVLLMSLEHSYPKASINDSDLDVLQLTEVSVLAAGLLPVLCKCVENIECFDLSVASMDLLLKMVLPPDIWVHVLHESIHLEHLIQIMHQQNSRVSVAVAFNFFLTMAQTKGGC